LTGRRWLCERPGVRRDRAGRLLVVLALGLVAGSCGGGDNPQKPDLPDTAALIPTAPAPQPTTTPSPTPIPPDQVIVVAPGGGGGGGGTNSAGCGAPYPPPVARFNVKVLSHQADRYVLDSTPLVGPDAAYCAKVGYPDRSICPVRLEGDPERSECEAAVVGIAGDTGRAGPTWSVNGGPCDGTDHGGGSCANHSTNQYLALAWGVGRFRACAASGVCGDIALP
jgi:hypothetical protein